MNKIKNPCMTRGFVVYIWLYYFRRSWWRRRRLLYLRRFGRRRWGHGRRFAIFIIECFFLGLFRQVIPFLCIIFFDDNGHRFLPSYRAYRWITGKKRVSISYDNRRSKFRYICFGRRGRRWWRRRVVFLCIYSQRS